VSQVHISVLRDEVIELLRDVDPPVIVDGTVGLGGHAEGLLEARGDLRLIGIDRDESALALAGQRLARFGERVRLIHGNFREAPALLGGLKADLPGGILLDLGVSSLQLDCSDRGFSLRDDGPLDMRMDRTAGLSASEWIHCVSEDDLVRALRDYGEERYARRIARAILAAREEAAIGTTARLKEIVHHAVPGKYFGEPIDPATRTFQAIRIAVNDEMGALDAGLQALFEMLAPGGVLAVISFHSLEDRRVKTFFRRLAADCICPPDLHDCLCDKRVEAAILTKKPIVPSAEEVRANPRARSAKLRAASKLEAG